MNAMRPVIADSNREAANRSVAAASAIANKPQFEKRRLSDLVDHPRQALYFDRLSDAELDALAHDIRRNGLRCRINVLPKNKAGLPPNVIIDGHQRRRAFQLLGTEEVEVIVRYDLANDSADQVERKLLEFNVNRRQLDKMAQARAAKRLIEIDWEQSASGPSQLDREDARDRIGKLIGMSGRNLERYWRILESPDEVQFAFRKKQLSLVVAGRVAALDPSDQKTIAQRIRDGKIPIPWSRSSLVMAIDEKFSETQCRISSPSSKLPYVESKTRRWTFPIISGRNKLLF